MQGYTTMSDEANQQLKEKHVDRPTHIFIQAGVGALSGSVAGYFACAYPKNPPIITIVEPNAADCLYRSADAHKIVNVKGDLKTIMAGLACGEPCSIS
jgi:diaminopropionate ammonia-lyase